MRTPRPGFGDRSPSRWTTHLKPKPCAPPQPSRIPTAVPLLHFLMRCLLPAGVAKLLGFHPLGMFSLVLGRRVIAVLTISALQFNDLAHVVSKPFRKRFVSPRFRRTKNYAMTSVTAPAPTVWPPSRMAKRNPFSSATGVISVTSQLTLSPGITISTPAGSFMSPVTSVVRK